MKRVLFVCVENSCRSQIAEGFARSFASSVFEAYSAGSKPSGVINPMAIDVMREAGVDISAQRSKGFDRIDVKRFDAVVTMGCGDVCPFVPAEKHIDWQIEDPKGKGIDVFRRVRDTIKDKVKDLSVSMSNNI